MVLTPVQADPRQSRRGLRPLLAQRDCPVKKRELDVFQRAGPRDQIEALKDEPDFPVPNLREGILSRPRNIPPIQPVVAASGGVQAADNVHERGFAGPRGAHDRHELSTLDLQADTAHRVHLDVAEPIDLPEVDRKSTRLNSSHDQISYAVFCLKKKK